MTLNCFRVTISVKMYFISHDDRNLVLHTFPTIPVKFFVTEIVFFSLRPQVRHNIGANRQRIKQSSKHGFCLWHSASAARRPQLLLENCFYPSTAAASPNRFRRQTSSYRFTLLRLYSCNLWLGMATMRCGAGLKTEPECVAENLLGWGRSTIVAAANKWKVESGLGAIRIFSWSVDCSKAGLGV